jgi:hypothetical protein
MEGRGGERGSWPQEKKLKLSKVLERRDLTLKKLLSEVEPGVLVSAFSTSNRALLRFLRKNGLWDRLGAQLCKYLMDSPAKQLSADNGCSVIQVAAYNILVVSNKGKELMSQKGAIQELASYSTLPRPCSEYVVSLWCHTVGAILRGSRTSARKWLLTHLKWRELIEPALLCDACMRELLVQWVWLRHQADSNSEEERGPLSECEDSEKLRYGLVKQKINVEGMGVGIVVSFDATKLFGPSKHSILFEATKKMRKLKLRRRNNGGHCFTIITEGPDQSTDAAVESPTPRAPKLPIAAEQMDTLLHLMVTVAKLAEDAHRRQVFDAVWKTPKRNADGQPAQQAQKAQQVSAIDQLESGAIFIMQMIDTFEPEEEDYEEGTMVRLLRVPGVGRSGTVTVCVAR